MYTCVYTLIFFFFYSIRKKIDIRDKSKRNDKIYDLLRFGDTFTIMLVLSSCLHRGAYYNGHKKKKKLSFDGGGDDRRVRETTENRKRMLLWKSGLYVREF